MSRPINLFPAETWHTSGSVSNACTMVVVVGGECMGVGVNDYHLQWQMAAPQWFPSRD